MKNNKSGLKTVTKLLKVVRPLSKFMAIAVLAGCISFLFYTAIGVMGAKLILQLANGKHHENDGWSCHLERTFQIS